MNNENVFKISLYKNAIRPTKGSAGAAGYDLYAFVENGNIDIQPGERKLINTGIQISIPSYCYARIAPRSGLAVKEIDICAGVVDSDYRGYIHALVVNNSKQVFTVAHGDRIAQMIFEQIINPVFVETPVLASTDRGNKGFGSTGV
jgi:dUTP pyrophosphatase